MRNSRSYPAWLFRAERVADVVQQRADDIFLVHAVAMGERRRLQRMRHAIDREPAAIAFEQLQMRQHALGQALC